MKGSIIKCSSMAVYLKVGNYFGTSSVALGETNKQTNKALFRHEYVLASYGNLLSYFLSVAKLKLNWKKTWRFLILFRAFFNPIYSALCGQNENLQKQTLTKHTKIILTKVIGLPKIHLLLDLSAKTIISPVKSYFLNQTLHSLLTLRASIVCGIPYCISDRMINIASMF